MKFLVHGTRFGEVPGLFSFVFGKTEFSVTVTAGNVGFVHAVRFYHAVLDFFSLKNTGNFFCVSVNLLSMTKMLEQLHTLGILGSRLQRISVILKKLAWISNG